MRRYAWALPLFAATALTSCATPMTAGADFDRDIEFNKYGTFAWGEDDGLPVGDPRLDDNPFFNERLHAAIQEQLERRGIRHDESSPGLLVHHHTAVRDHVEVYRADQNAGYTTDEYGAGTQVVEYEEGTFLVDIADAETKAILWRGWAVTNVETALNNPDEMSELLSRAVALMFERYPVAPATTQGHEQ